MVWLDLKGKFSVYEDVSLELVIRSGPPIERPIISLHTNIDYHEIF